MLNCLSFYLKERGHLYMRVHPFFATLPPRACAADPISYLCVAERLQTCKLQPNCGLFRTEKRAKTDFTAPARDVRQTPEKGEGLYCSYSGRQGIIRRAKGPSRQLIKEQKPLANSARGASKSSDTSHALTRSFVQEDWKSLGHSSEPS
jgi:hypothetical protein